MVDDRDEPDRRRCGACGKTKPIAAFYFFQGKRTRWSSYCRTCHWIQLQLHRETDQHRTWLAAYLRRPEVAARRRELDRNRRKTRRRREWRRRAMADPLARLKKQRAVARWKLRRVESGVRRAALERVVLLCDREVARIEADRAAKRKEDAES